MKVNLIRRKPLLQLCRASNHLPYIRLQNPRLDKNKVVCFVRAPESSGLVTRKMINHILFFNLAVANQHKQQLLFASRILSLSITLSTIREGCSGFPLWSCQCATEGSTKVNSLPPGKTPFILSNLTQCQRKGNGQSKFTDSFTTFCRDSQSQRSGALPFNSQ